MNCVHNPHPCLHPRVYAIPSELCAQYRLGDDHELEVFIFLASLFFFYRVLLSLINFVFRARELNPFFRS